MYTRTQVLCIRMQGSYPAFRQYLKCATGPRRHASRLSFSTDPQVTYLNRLLSFLEEDSGDSGIVAGCIRPSYANLIAAGGWKIKLKNTYYVGFLVLRYVAKGGPINLRKLRRCFFFRGVHDSDFIRDIMDISLRWLISNLCRRY